MSDPRSIVAWASCVLFATLTIESTFASEIGRATYEFIPAGKFSSVPHSKTCPNCKTDKRKSLGAYVDLASKKLKSKVSLDLPWLHERKDRTPDRPQKPLCVKPGDIDRGQCPPERYLKSGSERAGSPQSVAKWAQCSVGPKYSGSYVGGGSAFNGCGRPSDAGTWGLDFHGTFLPGTFFMDWTKGRPQGGEGEYQTDREPRTRVGEHIHSRAHQRDASH